MGCGLVAVRKVIVLSNDEADVDVAVKNSHEIRTCEKVRGLGRRI